MVHISKAVFGIVCIQVAEAARASILSAFERQAVRMDPWRRRSNPMQNANCARDSWIPPPVTGPPRRFRARPWGSRLREEPYSSRAHRF